MGVSRPLKHGVSGSEAYEDAGASGDRSPPASRVAQWRSLEGSQGYSWLTATRIDAYGSSRRSYMMLYAHASIYKRIG